MPSIDTLQNAEELLRLFFNQTSEHVLMLLDTEGRITAWQKAAEKVFGYTPSEVIGQPVAMLFTPENLEAGMDKYERDVARTDIEAEDDRWMLRKDGTRFWATGTLAPLKNDRGELIGFAKALSDRTDMRAQMETIENQIQLLQQKEKRKDRFISTLAHELRNPLASVATAVNLMKVTEPGSEDHSLGVSSIERGLQSMSTLVNDLLEATRAGTGKIKLEKKAQPLGPIVEAAIESCRSSIDTMRQRVNYVKADTPLIVDVDASRIQQVLVNLIENAARATRNGGTIWIKVSLEADEAVIKVEDDGIGISPELLPQIFDLFTQAEFAGDQRDAGLGIGLSVVKDVTTLHGGSVQVRSDGIGKGSEFTVRLPLAEKQ